MVLCVFLGNFGFYVETPGLWISREIIYVQFLLKLHKFYSRNEVDMNMGKIVKMWFKEWCTGNFFSYTVNKSNILVTFQNLVLRIKQFSARTCKSTPRDLHVTAMCLYYNICALYFC